MAPVSRVRVAFEDLKLVVPVGNNNDSVKRLIADITRRFKEKGAEGDVAELQTSDGYAIDGTDLIGEVLADGDELRALDRAAWLKDTLPLCDTTWALLTRPDFTDQSDWSKFVAVGLTRHKRLFIGLGHGRQLRSTYSKVLSLDVFDVNFLKQAGKVGQAPTVLAEATGTTEGGGTYELRALYERTSSGCLVHASVKPGHAQTATVHVLTITLDGDRISIPTPANPKASVRVAADPAAPAGQQGDQPSLPHDVVEARAFAQDAARYPDLGGEDERKPPREGAVTATLGPVHIAQDHDYLIELTQGWEQRGSFNNTVACNFRLVNKDPNKQTAFIEDVRVEYQAASGEWVRHDRVPAGALAPSAALVGSRSGYYYYSWNNSRTLKLEHMALETVAVGLEFEIPISAAVHQVDTHRRLHWLLPHPLKLRYTFIDDKGAEAVLETVATNPPLALYDEVRYRGDIDSNRFELFRRLDDVDTESCVAVGIASELADDQHVTELKVQIRDHGGAYLSAQSLAKLAYQAAQAGKDEVDIENLDMDKSNEATGVRSCKVTGLVSGSAVYALKIAMATNTGKATYYFRVPPVVPKDD